MPNLHDIERRINSVASTKQITRTMEMVAAAKIRRATERMANSLPWANAVSDALISTAKYVTLEDQPLLAKRAEVKRALVVVVTSDRGLAGGFNSNVLRAAEKVRDTPAQKTLTRRERADNLKGCFRVADRRGVKGKCILIVDDTYTTGATVDELAAVLLRAGAKEVNAVTVTSVEDKSPYGG